MGGDLHGDPFRGWGGSAPRGSLSREAMKRFNVKGSSRGGC
ncbi:hypothetical protein STVIR_7632 [Streptomyces viridochromogenes Tue57]|uniref:Uncharacterized protein n=1 Tax=Streptomyces viridochromogenes Tue57 TaxID=1160705 RepID=L8P5P2_STRVR|nr:hypothetical protein STVIR_7632 [Streptomyces viridochromogenes Tue57]